MWDLGWVELNVWKGKCLQNIYSYRKFNTIIIIICYTECYVYNLTKQIIKLGYKLSWKELNDYAD